jgi:hypothetical protein
MIGFFFRDTREALARGFEIYDRLPEGRILVRRRTGGRFELAVALRES